MAEDLTEYLEEHGERVRYLHQISTPSNVWRLSATCVWVSSRIGRDQLTARRSGYAGSFAVAILDADKEGFLRSERSLIQPLVVRHVTLTVKRFSTAIRSPINGESDWRNRTSPRETAEDNEEHGITPQGLNKKVVDILRWGRTLPKPKRRAEENRDRF